MEINAKNMLFWQISFLSEGEHRQLCFAFLGGGVLLLIFCFLVFAESRSFHHHTSLN